MQWRFVISVGDELRSNPLTRGKAHRLAMCVLFLVALAPLARGGGDPCENFGGPFEPCVGPFWPHSSAASATGYPTGQTPYSHPGIFPLIQVCGGPVVAGEAPGDDSGECPPCLFTGLSIDLLVYPARPSDFICDVSGFLFPFGTTFTPPLNTPGLLPSGACPLELKIDFPDALVVCPGSLTWTGIVETDSEPIDPDKAGGGSRAFREFGFELTCVKTLEEAIARSLGVIPIVLWPDLDGKPLIFSVPFAVANRSKSPHEVHLSLEWSAPWSLVTEAPPALLLQGGESTTVFVEFEIPPGAPIGETNIVTMTVDLDGLPDTVYTEVVELVLESPPPPDPLGVPTASEWGLVIMALLILSAGTIVIGRSRSTAGAYRCEVD